MKGRSTVNVVKFAVSCTVLCPSLSSQFQLKNLLLDYTNNSKSYLKGYSTQPFFHSQNFLLISNAKRSGIVTGPVKQVSLIKTKRFASSNSAFDSSNYLPYYDLNSRILEFNDKGECILILFSKLTANRECFSSLDIELSALLNLLFTDNNYDYNLKVFFTSKTFIFNNDLLNYHEFDVFDSLENIQPLNRDDYVEYIRENLKQYLIANYTFIDSKNLSNHLICEHNDYFESCF